MMLAILSDIHGNLEALQAVLRDAESMKADSIICLGDLIGYGPDPCECIELAMDFRVVLRGNFDDAMLHQEWGNEWMPALIPMMERIKQRISEHPNGQQLMAFLSRSPSYYQNNDAIFVHGSPRNHIHEYVFPEHIYDQEKMVSIFSQFDRLCFCGHSHIAGVFNAKSETEWTFNAPTDRDNVFAVGDKQMLCNVGSVGQPRDGDSRACYVLFDGETIVYRRVDYDMQTTIDKIRSGDDDDMHGERLEFGR